MKARKKIDIDRGVRRERKKSGREKGEVKERKG